MSTPIRIKRSTQSGKRPTLDHLQKGELAINIYDGHLFAERDTGGVGIGTTITLLTPWQEDYGSGAIGYSGNVGINSTSPKSNLDVLGTVNVTGFSTFRNNVYLLDNNKLLIGGILGSHDGLEIYHDTNDSYIKDSGTGSLNIDASFTGIRNANGNKNVATFTDDTGATGGVSLYWDNSKKFQTADYGIDVTGRTETDSLNVSGLSTFTGDVSFGSTATFGDDDKIIMGAGSDLQIYHDGSNSYIADTATGELRILSNDFIVRKANNSGTIIRGVQNAQVELYYNNDKKFETTGAGVTITGKADVNGNLIVSGFSTFNSDVSFGSTVTFGDNDKIKIGASSDLQIYHNSTASYIDNNTGPLYIRNNVNDDDGANIIIEAKSGKASAVFQDDEGVRLYYDNSEKFVTTVDGIKVRNGSSETAVITGPQNIILDPIPDDVVAITTGAISSIGVSTITGITTTNIAVGNLIREVDGVISTATTVTSVGIESLTISNVSLGAVTNQEFVFANPSPTGKVIIFGDLQVDGTQTVINSAILEVDYKTVSIAKSATNASQANDAGIEVNGANATLKYNYNGGNDQWVFNKAPYYNTNRLLTTADQGTGNNLDADKLDGQEGTHYLNYANFTGIATDSDKLDGQEGTHYLNYANFTGIATDSDKLDGQEGTHYLDYNNFTNTPTINNATLTLQTSGDGISGSDTFTANQSVDATFTVSVSSASTNDANTLVYRDASGGFSAGIITSTQIGIGTDEPTSKLSIGSTLSYLNSDGIGVYKPHSAGSKNGIFVYTDVAYNSTSSYRAAAFKAVGLSGHALGISTDANLNALGGDQNAFINFDGSAYFGGNIGINTLTPKTDFHILGSAIVGSDTAVTIDSYSTLVIGDRPQNDGHASLTFKNNNDNLSAKIDGTSDGLNVWSNKNSILGERFKWFGGSTTEHLDLMPRSQNVMRVQHDGSVGRVGIGSTQPTATLDVDGTLNVSGIATANKFVKSGGTSSQFLKADGSVDNSTYLTSYTETKNLDDVVGLGSVTTQTITVGTATTGVVLNPNGELEVLGTGYLQIPVGLNSQRPTGTGVTLGQIRYNSELSTFEGYGAGNAWGSLGGIKDVDGDTYISAESSAGADEDRLTFYTVGTEKVGIDSLGNVGIGSTQPTATLDVNGNLNVSGVSTFQDNIGIASEKYIQQIAGDNTTSVPHRVIKGYGGTGNFYREYAYSNVGGSTPTYFEKVENGINYEIAVGNDSNFTIGNNVGRPISEFNKSFEVDINGATSLYYNYNKKLGTTGYGVSVTGGLNVSGIATFGGFNIDGSVNARSFVGSGEGLTNIDAYAAYTSDRSTLATIADKISGITIYSEDQGFNYLGGSESYHGNSFFYGADIEVSDDGKVMFVSSIPYSNGNQAGCGVQIYERTTSNFNYVGFVTSLSHHTLGVGQTIGDLSNWFGPTLASNADGSIFAVGSPNSVPQTGSNNEYGFWDVASPWEGGHGYINIFQKTGNTIESLGIITAPYADIDNNYASMFGHAVALNADGTKLYVSAPGIQTNTYGYLDNGIHDQHGLVYAYNKNGTSYQQVGVLTSRRNNDITIPHTWGHRVVCSDDGDTIYISGPTENFTSSLKREGVVEVYSRTGNSFTHVGIITSGNDPNGTIWINGDFGVSMDCSSDGNIIAIAALPGPNNTQTPPGGHGALLVFEKTGTNTFTKIAEEVFDENTSGSDPVYSSVKTGKYDLKVNSDASLIVMSASELISVSGNDPGGRFVAFSRDGGNISRIGAFTPLTPQPSGATFDYMMFGTSLAIDSTGNNVFAGAPIHPLGNTSNTLADKGSAYVFNISRQIALHSNQVTGNIGIGTDSPTATLDVNGTLKAQELIGDGSQLRGIKSNQNTFYSSSSNISNTSRSISGISTYTKVGIFTGNSESSASQQSGSMRKVKLSADGEIMILGQSGYFAHNPKPNNGEGLVYFARKNASGTYTQVGIITSADSNENTESDEFGRSIAITPDAKTLVVGAPAAGVNTEGQAYVYDLEGDTYSQVGILTGNTGNGQIYFGEVVDIDSNGKTIAISATGDTAPGTASGAGAVYVFDRNSDDTFTRVGILTGAFTNNSHSGSNDPQSSQYGQNLQVVNNGNTVVVGSPEQERTSGGYHYGSVEIWDRDITTNQFSRVHRIFYDPTTEDLLGQELGSGLFCTDDGRIMIIGDWHLASNDANNFQTFGGFHVYERSGNTFTRKSTTYGPVANIDFGRQSGVVANADASIVVVAETSNNVYGVYVFEKVNENYDYNLVAKYQGDEAQNIANIDKIGQSIAITADGKTIAACDNDFNVQAPGTSVTGTGIVYIHEQQRQEYLSVVSSYNHGLISSGNSGLFLKLENHTPEAPIGLNEDIGQNWEEMDLSLLFDDSARQITCSQYCGDGIVIIGTGYGSGYSDLYRSTDYGITWVKVYEGTKDSVEEIIYCGNGTVIAAIVGQNLGDGGICRSTDYGVTWTTQQLHNSNTYQGVYSLEYCGNGIVIAGTGNNNNGKIYRSTNYGVSWSSPFTLSDSNVVINYVNELKYCGNGIAIAGVGDDSSGTGDMYRCIDVAASSYYDWQKIEMGDSTIGHVQSLEYCGGGILLIGTGYSNGDADIYRSTDYGRTVSKIDPTYFGTASWAFGSIRHCGNGIVLASTWNHTTGVEIFKSTDYGVTWTLVKTFASSYISEIGYCGNGIVFAAVTADSGTGSLYRSEVGFSQAKTLQGVYHQTGTGNIGIGSTQPTATLDVDGTLNVSGKLGINIGTATTAFVVDGSSGQLFSVVNNLSSGSIFSVNDISGIPSIDVDADGTIQLAPIVGLGQSVGIGTTNPLYKLDVNGDIRAGQTSGEGLILTSPNGTKYRLTVDNSGNLGTTAA